MNRQPLHTDDDYDRPDVLGIILIMSGVTIIWCAIGFVAGVLLV